MNEIWKTIIDYEDYEISNLGQVRNKKTEKILKPGEHGRGYLHVGLWKGGKQKTFLLHRLVGEAFIPNPSNLPQLNHKDECKQNNHVSNLEWCSASYNDNYGTRNQRVTEKNSKPVLCIETGEIYVSAKDAQRKTGYYQSSISRACNGELKTAYGYHWEYA